MSLDHFALLADLLSDIGDTTFELDLRVFLFIARRGGDDGLTAVQTCAVLALEKYQVFRAVQRLEKRGLVRRVRPDRDGARRDVWLEATSEGARIAGRLGGLIGAKVVQVAA